MASNNRDTGFCGDASGASSPAHFRKITPYVAFERALMRRYLLDVLGNFDIDLFPTYDSDNVARPLGQNKYNKAHFTLRHAVLYVEWI
ncbi:unnamed protein product [Brugia pahangi]|uniref:Transposase n=1 Tax=Brugia pahangi TaxID=6280 RepID=A0A0N4SX97_BRUPA|nr:unnamed protein product [Brugia pahangi]